MINTDSDIVLLHIKQAIALDGWEVIREKVTTESSRASTSKIDIRLIIKPILEFEEEEVE